MMAQVDLIACRNLLIYLDRDLQELACNTFPLRAQSRRIT